MDQTYMKQKPILPLVLSMSLPMILSMMVNALYNIIDSFFVAKISENAMTALSLVYPVQNLIGGVTIGFGVGMNAVIAFYLGAQDQKKVDAAATQGVLLSVLHGALLTVGCTAVMPTFLRAFTREEALVSLGLRYSNIVFRFSVVIALGLAFEKIFQAVGAMKVSMFSMMAGCVTNILLDPVLIFGLGPAPALGIEGAAIATGVGQCVTLGVYVLFYLARPIPVRLHLRRPRWDPAIVKKLYAIGAPAAANQGLPSLLIAALNGILSGFAPAYVLVLGVYYKLQTFLYLSANGLIQGIRPLVGYNYGAGEYGRVKKIYSTTLLLTLGIMCAGTAVCLACPAQLIGLFTENAATTALGAAALRIISAGFIVSSASIVSSGTLEGLGMGTASLVISLCRYLVVIVPAAFLLSRAFGGAGVWHAFWLTEWFSAAVAFWAYRKKTRAFLG